MYKWLAVLLLCVAACRQPAPTQQNDVLALKEMSELATVEYTITKIIKANDNKTWFKIGDRKILMSCEGRIKAGVDLGALTDADYQVSGKDITINLPAPKIISLSLPPEKIKVEYQEVGFFRSDFKTQERDQLAAQAEAQIRNSVQQLGILPQARANTSLFVGRFLRQAGFQNITIQFPDTTITTRMPQP